MLIHIQVTRPNYISPRQHCIQECRKYSDEKRVRRALGADSRSRAVAGIDARLVRQNEQLLADASDQRIEVAAREVGSPDTAGKQRIAGEYGRFIFDIKAHMASRMTGSVEDFEPEVADFDDLPFFDLVVDGWCRGSGDAEHQARFFEVVESELVLRMQIKRSAGLLLHRNDGPDVINVCVGVDDPGEREADGFDNLPDGVWLVHEMDERSLAGFFTAEEVRVFLKFADDTEVEMHEFTAGAFSGLFVFSFLRRGWWLLIFPWCGLSWASRR